MDETLNRLRSELTGRYEVEAELGRGGMAVVYLAKDLRHDRRVALKVMREDIGVAESAERFLREIRTAAQLHHPHILPLYDSGTAGHQLFYVMPFVQGESVRQRLEREGPFPVEEAVRIAREVADALEYAHTNGIVHRDIKPENILLSGGHASVADFGIARAADAAGFKTETGVAVGTPSYMSPEQAMADPHIDGRADQYALGCVLYEMLAGHPPFQGPTSQAIMARHTTDAVPPLTTIRLVTPALESVVVKALAKMPADRWPSTKAFAESLEAVVPTGTSARVAISSGRRRLSRVSIGVASVVLLGVAGWMASQRIRAQGTGADEFQRVAVLPFAYGTDTAQAALAGGLAEGVSAGLVRAKLNRLSVLSGPRVESYADRTTDPQQAGRDLGATAVLTASLRVAGNKIRVAPQLTDVTTGRTLWSDHFDFELVVNGKVQDLFDVIDSITMQIVGAMRPELTPASRAAIPRGVQTRDAEAYRLYLEARHATHTLTQASIDRALALLKQALARDSTYADAWVALANVFNWGNPSGMSQSERDALHDLAIARAIEYDNQNGFAYALRATIKRGSLWDWDGAWRDYRKAVTLAPASPDVALEYAIFLDYAAEPESALFHMRRAVQLDPSNAVMWGNLSTRHGFAVMHDSALRAGEHARQLDSTQGHLILAHEYLHFGRRADADRAMELMLRYSSANPALDLAFAADYYRRAGNASKAREMLERITSLSGRLEVPTWETGLARLAVGDRLGALDALEQTQGQEGSILYLILSQSLLRGEPRWEAVRQKVFGNRPMPRNPFPDQ